MDVDVGRAGLDHQVDEAVEALLGVLIVDADAALDRHRQVGGVAHGAHAVGHQLRLRHQAGAEAARLHAVGRAADIEVDLVIAERRGNPRRLGQFGGIGAAELHRDRMLDIAGTPAAARGRHARSPRSSPSR